MSLTSLTQGAASAHSGLLGLDGDDHTQYLTTGRHWSTHGADFNSSLTVPADVDGNFQSVSWTHSQNSRHEFEIQGYHNSFKADNLPIPTLAKNAALAQKIYDRAGWK